LRLEKEAHARTQQDLEELKRLVAGPSGVDATMGANMDRLTPVVPSTRTLLVESIDTDTPERSVKEDGMTATDEATMVKSASLNTKQVRNNSLMRHPSYCKRDEGLQIKKARKISCTSTT